MADTSKSKSADLIGDALENVTGGTSTTYRCRCCDYAYNPDEHTKVFEESIDLYLQQLKCTLCQERFCGCKMHPLLHLQAQPSLVSQSTGLAI